MLWTIVGIVLLIVFGPIALQILWELRWLVLVLVAAAFVGLVMLLGW